MMFPEEDDFTPEQNTRSMVRYNFIIVHPRSGREASVTGTAFPVSGDEIAKLTRRVKKETA